DVAVWRDRANWIEDRLGLMHAEELDALPDFPGADPRQWWWLGPLQLAKTANLPFYCDDAWLRRLAASLGVSAFGTVDLLSVLAAIGGITPASHARASVLLRDCRATAISISAEELLAFGRRDG